MSTVSPTIAFAFVYIVFLRSTSEAETAELYRQKRERMITKESQMKTASVFLAGLLACAGMVWGSLHKEKVDWFAYKTAIVVERVAIWSLEAK